MFPAILSRSPLSDIPSTLIQDFMWSGEVITGEYHKWMDNNGNVDDLRNTPHAFAHFTYEASGQQMMVVDIQGVTLLTQTI